MFPLLDELVYTFLLSISPFGEARSGIPYAIFNDVHILLAFAVGLTANILVFPLFSWIIDKFSHKFWHIRFYRKGVVQLCRRAKRAVGVHNQKWGFWGLMVFVMVPLPGTGAYLGTIAAHVLKLDRKKAFISISTGLVISSLFMAAVAYYSNRGLDLL
ncbi:COG2426 family protein [Cesiribacter andamanensis]|uniref:Putative membrane protein n=1 Tax=Cesiribacter andamanensis AMV16 TaxID=1279009 RepID=M7NKY9_9BACT|nr:small multi-drug export protein [Cesiribacter andamanensis]EMR02460.1 putative membrane protein [Cesiribacter andamanensis AMV16]